MVADEKPQILNCNIQFYFKSIEQTITFKLCFISQFKCNGLHDSFEIELNITICGFSSATITTLDKQPVFYYNFISNR